MKVTLPIRVTAEMIRAWPQKGGWHVEPVTGTRVFLGENSVICGSVHLGTHVFIGRRVTIVGGGDAWIGDRVHISKGCFLDRGVVVHNDTTIGRHVYIGQDTVIGGHNKIGMTAQIGHCCALGANVHVEPAAHIAPETLVQSGRRIPANPQRRGVALGTLF